MDSSVKRIQKLLRWISKKMSIGLFENGRQKRPAQPEATKNSQTTFVNVAMDDESRGIQFKKLMAAKHATVALVPN